MARARRVVVAFGTRPEAIKMAPVVRALRDDPNWEPLVVVTAQHRQMLDQVLDLFGIVPDVDLDLMQPDQSLDELTSRVLLGMGRAIGSMRPDALLVHGDTTTTLASALAGFYARVPVGHVEAGLRSGDMDAPWPEEMNRSAVAKLAALHFAPTDRARTNLLDEGISPQRIHVTGNTVVDALLQTSAVIDSDASIASRCASRVPTTGSAPVVLVTCHRRESFGPPFLDICSALRDLAEVDGMQIIFPVHPNPNIRNAAYEQLSGVPSIQLLDPLDYAEFVYLMRKSDVVLTDSGGIQEEAPSFGKPVLVMRRVTERHEAIEAGTAKLIGTDRGTIVASVRSCLASAYGRTPNPYGDGNASARIITALGGFLTDHSP